MLSVDRCEERGQRVLYQYQYVLFVLVTRALAINESLQKLTCDINHVYFYDSLFLTVSARFVKLVKYVANPLTEKSY